MKVSLNVYLFLMLSAVSFSVFAGADPDELTLEEEMQMQKSAKKEMVEKVSKAEVIETASMAPEGCACLFQKPLHLKSTLLVSQILKKTY